MDNATQTAATSAPTSTAASAPAGTTAPVTTSAPATPPAATTAAPMLMDSSTPPAAAPAATEVTPPAEGDKPADGAEVTGAPEAYAEFKTADGEVMNAGVLEDFKAFAKAKNLSQEDAQAFAEMGSKVAQEQRDAYTAQITEAQAKWANDSRADKEFGGDKLGENMAIAKQAMDTFGSPELVDLLRTSGLGNHPEFIRLFYRTGLAISQDKLVRGGNAPSTAQTVAQRLYPGMNP